MSERVEIRNFNQIQGCVTKFPSGETPVYKIYVDGNTDNPYYMAAEIYSKLCQALTVDKECYPNGVELEKLFQTITMPEPGIIVRF